MERCFHVSEDSVQRAYKKFVEKGEEGFFAMMREREQPTKSPAIAACAYKLN